MIGEVWEAPCGVHGFDFGTSRDLLRPWVGHWRVQKGKGALLPATRLNFLVAVYEKMKELLSLSNFQGTLTELPRTGKVIPLLHHRP